MVCRNEEITILREFQSRKESLKYLQKLPLEHKINLSKNLILNCIETFGDQQVYISFSGGKDSITMLNALKALQRFYPKKFELIAISIDPRI